ncbi:CHASE2 domain-containing protein [Winogradskyella sp. A2]|uniref:CHASE2 domain-containing protein n=1 Tax=Winogradskyella sp. A2 TaxID=3366944 RepID=UPI00398C3971
MKRKTKLLFRDAFLSTILSCILLGLLWSIVFFNSRFFNPIHQAFEDFSFLDVFYSEKLEESNKIADDVILLNIENHGRDIIAPLLETILEEDPKVVGFDVILEKHQTHNYADTLLRKLLQNEKVITSFSYENNTIINNESFFNLPKESGFVNFNYNDNTNVIREFEAYKEIAGKTRSSFATMIAKKYLKSKKWKKYNYEEKLQDAQYIKYKGNIESFPVLTANDFLFGESKSFLKDKVVIIGYLGKENSDNKSDINDKFWTPLNSRIAGKSDRDMYGAVVHANIVDMLINNDLIHKVSNLWLGIITFVCMYLSTMFYMKLNKKYKISYRTRKQTYQFIFSVSLLVLVFWLLTIDILLRPFLIIVGVLVAGSYFKYYKHLTRHLNTKRKFKTYLK